MLYVLYIYEEIEMLKCRYYMIKENKNYMCSLNFWLYIYIYRKRDKGILKG